MTTIRFINASDNNYLTVVKSDVTPPVGSLVLYAGRTWTVRAVLYAIGAGELEVRVSIEVLP